LRKRKEERRRIAEGYGGYLDMRGWESGEE
jgi:hypothetical protein